MKTIIISGASTGIGKSFVTLASTAPDNHIIVLSKHQLEYEVPANVEIHLVDITNYPRVNRIINKVAQNNQIDVLINNAGNGWRGMIEDTTLDEAKQQLEVNVWGLINLTNQVLPHMRKNRSGHIINISSVSAHINYGTIGYYSATKAFIEKLSEVLALELKPWNVQVSLIAPGAVRTKFGHNMINIKKYNRGDYSNFYRLWADRFEVMFQQPISSDIAARKIIDIMNSPKTYSFVTKRDAVYCYIKKIIPRKVFNVLLLKRYMHYE